MLKFDAGILSFFQVTMLEILSAFKVEFLPITFTVAFELGF